MVFLNSYGIGTARAVRIYKEYGDRAIEQVKSNPYRLTTDIWGIGFKTADELAMQLGLPKDSLLRARAAVRFTLQELSSKGHVGYPEHAVIDETMRLTNIPPEIIGQAIEAGRQEDELVRDKAARLRRSGRNGLAVPEAALSGRTRRGPGDPIAGSRRPPAAANQSGRRADLGRTENGHRVRADAAGSD